MNILDIQKLIQFRETWDAQQELEKIGFTLRIVELEGQPCISTRDFRRDRVNTRVADGRIIDVVGIG